MRFLARELLEFLDDVVDELGTRRDVEYVNTILERGTSADRQLKTYKKIKFDGGTNEEALHAVVDQIVRETSVTYAT